MDLKNFEIKNFKARDGIEDSSKKLVAETLKAAGFYGVAKVFIVERNKAFFFSIVGIIQNKIFTNDLSFQKDKIHGWPRDWQFGAVSKLIYQFIHNLKSQGLKNQNKIEDPSGSRRK